MKSIRLTLSLFALLSMPTVALAAEALQLELTGGETVTYVLSSKPRVTFMGDQMKITSTDASADYARNQVLSMRFVSDQGVDRLIADGEYSISYTDNTLRAPEREIFVYNLSGRLVGKGYGEFLTVDLEPGVYVAKTSEATLKILK